MNDVSNRAVREFSEFLNSIEADYHNDQGNHNYYNNTGNYHYNNNTGNYHYYNSCDYHNLFRTDHNRQL